jgi:hypothetical protein
MKRLFIILGVLILLKGILFTLASCGIDGAPTPPPPRSTTG